MIKHFIFPKQILFNCGGDGTHLALIHFALAKKIIYFVAKNIGSFAFRHKITLLTSHSYAIV